MFVFVGFVDLKVLTYELVTPICASPSMAMKIGRTALENLSMAIQVSGSQYLQLRDAQIVTLQHYKVLNIFRLFT
jgi:hypothetical protein